MPLPLTFKPFLSCHLLILFHLPAGTQERTVPAKTCLVSLNKVLLARRGIDVVRCHLLDTGGCSRLATMFIVTVDAITALWFDRQLLYGKRYPDRGIMCPFESLSLIQGRLCPHIGEIFP